MGYTTKFLGSFYFSRSLTEQELTFLTAFCASRRVKWNTKLLQSQYCGAHGNPFTPSDPYGPEGDYCIINPTIPMGVPDSAVADYNEPPVGQPSLWCSWCPSTNGNELSWNGAEKFNEYVEWLQYLIDHFFEPWGVDLNGAVQWEGEDYEDLGVISVRCNRIQIHYETCEDSDQEN